MAWGIEVTNLARKNLDALDPQIARRIVRFLDEHVAALENPRLIGEALKGQTLGSFWKYRVGDYRIVASLEDDVLRVLIVRVGNRREVCRR
jgi:mRNA interferase RelE/StbE